MRINKFIAAASGMSRRAADAAISDNQVTVNGTSPSPGHNVTDNDVVKLNNIVLAIAAKQTIILNKPVGYVVSRSGQGSQTIYDLLPADLHTLKPVGRLDKDSSGLLLLTNDGDLANQLTHPSYQKRKVYQVTLDKPLQPLHRQMIADKGLALEDGPSRLDLERQIDGDDTAWIVTMHEGRNRQIRRTFAALGYDVQRLHRTTFGNFAIDTVAPGKWRTLLI